MTIDASAQTDQKTKPLSDIVQEKLNTFRIDKEQVEPTFNGKLKELLKENLPGQYASFTDPNTGSEKMLIVFDYKYENYESQKKIFSLSSEECAILPYTKELQTALDYNLENDKGLTKTESVQKILTDAFLRANEKGLNIKRTYHSRHSSGESNIFDSDQQIQIIEDATKFLSDDKGKNYLKIIKGAMAIPEDKQNINKWIEAVKEKQLILNEQKLEYQKQIDEQRRQEAEAINTKKINAEEINQKNAEEINIKNNKELDDYFTKFPNGRLVFYRRGPYYLIESTQVNNKADKSKYIVLDATEATTKYFGENNQLNGILPAQVLVIEKDSVELGTDFFLNKSSEISPSTKVQLKEPHLHFQTVMDLMRDNK